MNGIIKEEIYFKCPYDKCKKIFKGNKFEGFILTENMISELNENTIINGKPHQFLEADSLINLGFSLNFTKIKDEELFVEYLKKSSNTLAGIYQVPFKNDKMKKIDDEIDGKFFLFIF